MLHSLGAALLGIFVGATSFFLHLGHLGGLADRIPGATAAQISAEIAKDLRPLDHEVTAGETLGAGSDKITYTVKDDPDLAISVVDRRPASRSRRSSTSSPRRARSSASSRRPGSRSSTSSPTARSTATRR